MHIFTYCCARFSWKLSVKVVFIFSSKTRILVWCGLKQAENELKTTHPRLWFTFISFVKMIVFRNDRIQLVNDLYKNSGTVYFSTRQGRAYVRKEARKKAAVQNFAKVGPLPGGGVGGGG